MPGRRGAAADAADAPPGADVLAPASTAALGRPLPNVRVVATDYDRTFTRLDLSLDPDALAAAGRLRNAGLRLVLATGRHQSYLDSRPELLQCFDACIIEGGALWRNSGPWQLTEGDLSPLGHLTTALTHAGVDFDQGTASLSLLGKDEAELRRMPQAKAVTWRRNGDRIDVTPRGVDKAAGLRRVLQEWGIPASQAVALGDGENDVPLLSAVGHGFAVANAHAALKAVAHEVAPVAASQAFVWLANRLAPRA